MPLEDYRKKRRFAKTPEPKGDTKPRRQEAHLFVIQKHRATALHYDFRLEANGVLVSWAVPRGPSLDPSQKRLAMHVEDHPIEYARFEGVIPEGEYGGGTVMVWDIGTYALEEDGDFDVAYAKGRLTFALNGKKLKGTWSLIRTGPSRFARSADGGSGSGGLERGDRQWLLFKRTDRYASKDVDITAAKPRSVLSRRLLAQIARAGGGDVEKAATGDPR